MPEWDEWIDHSRDYNDEPEEEEDILPTDSPYLIVGSKTVATFEKSVKPYSSEENLISKSFGRKHILVDELSAEPIPGIQYTVELVRESMTGGSFIARINERTVFGSEMLELQQDGWSDPFRIPKTTGFDEDERTPEEAIRTYKITFDKVKKGKWEFKVLPHGEGKGTEPDEDVYTVLTRPVGVDIPRVIDPLEKTKYVGSPEKVRSSITPIEKMSNGNLRVLDLEVIPPVERGNRLPSEKKFNLFTYDKTTLEMYYRMASAWNRRSPFFTEGASAVSKTSVAEKLALDLGLDVYRLNMSGQSDTSELIGRFIPNDGTAQLEYDNAIKGWSSSDETLREAALNKMSIESAAIMRTAFSEKRELSKEENSAISRSLGMHISESMWVWKNGVATEAALKGGMLLIDEATLSVPEVIERLNSLLEKPSSLTLTENGGMVIGPDGDHEINPNFWVVGTGNSASMAGRTLFSEALQRRLSDYYMAPEPTVKDYEQMLDFFVTGKQPEVTIRGIKYKMPDAPKPPFEKLQKIPDIHDFTRKLATIHMDMIRITDPSTGSVGKERRRGGKYAVTRQNLMSVMEYISNERLLDVEKTIQKGEPVYYENWNDISKRAVERFYVDSAQLQDQSAIKTVIESHGSLFSKFKVKDK